jgi:ABC-type multidrug transport system fused ATPase/permease subunit
MVIILPLWRFIFLYNVYRCYSIRQIADKFNEMQLGMIAANRVFLLFDTADQIQDTGTVEAPIFHGNLHFKDVHFSYIPDEEVIKESI